MKILLICFVLCALCSAEIRDYTISLRAISADPLQLASQKDEYKRLATRQSEAMRMSAAKEYWLIQCAGPLLPAWRTQLNELGCEDVQYIKNYCLLVRAEKQAVAAATDLPFVRWAGSYRPEYKIAGTIPRINVYVPDATEAVPDQCTVIVQFFRGADLDRLKEELSEAGAVVLKKAGGEYSDYFFRVRIPGSAVEQLAALSEVVWIEPAAEYHTHNDRAREEIINVRPVWSAGYRGLGEIVCVADSGLDVGIADNKVIHRDFTRYWYYGFPFKLTNTTRVVRIDDWFGDGAQDVFGHGTHVAGSVLGAGYLSGANVLLTPTNSLAGVAPLASLMFQAVGSNYAGSALHGIPDSMVDLLLPAWDEGARVHQDSWGGGVRGAYTTLSSTIDSFVGNPLMPKWDDMVVVFSAGNDAVDYVISNQPNNAHWTRAGVIDYDSISAPGTAKDCITVGASENIRPDITAIWNSSKYPRDPIRTDRRADNKLGMCAFSSRGPCDDLRVKPDIVAPGSYIASALSRAASPTALWGPYPPNTNYIYSGGTSMAAPQVSGAAALVREWLNDEYGVTNPSAALVKALLLNNAASMYPGQYDLDHLEIPSTVPNQVCGYGLLDVQNVIAPTGTSVRLWWDRPGALVTGETNEHEFVVDDPSVPLHVMLVWSDVPATPAANGGLVNDLDFLLTSPGDQPYKGLPRDYRFIKSYDANNADGYITNTAGEGFAVKFTPDYYPVRIWGALAQIGWMGTGIEYDIKVWDDDGFRGQPGTLLYTGHKQGCSFYWDESFIPNISITSGSFYIELRCLEDQYPGLYYKATGAPDRSWHWNGTSWSQPNREYMIRAIMRDPYADGHDRVNNVQHYRVANPAMGTWTLKVIGHDIWLPQHYAVTVSGGMVIPEPAGVCAMLAGIVGMAFRRWKV